MKIIKKFLFSAVFTVMLSTYVYAQETLIYASTLIRHGDRSPTRSLNIDPYKWKNGIGELTPHGMHQEFELGSKMRKRYVDELKLLSENYVNNTVYVRCTNFNRTIMSAQSFLYGLYPLGTGPKLTDNKPALPELYQPIPLRTLPKDQDYLLLAKDNYVKQFESEALKYLQKDENWKTKNKEAEKYFKQWGKLFKIKINNLMDIIGVGDNLNVRIKNNAPMPKGISKEEAETIIHYAKWAQAQRYKPKYISAPLAKKLLAVILDSMKDAIKEKNSYKYTLYSAHDSTVMPVMSAIGAPLDYCPPYASHIDFELYQEGGSYNVKIRYDDKPVLIGKNNTDSSISFDDFSKLVESCQKYSYKK